MRVCEVIGSVTLSRAHPAVTGIRMLLAKPFRLADLESHAPPGGEELVVVDQLGAGAGSIIGISEGREAAMPYHPAKKPIDAYCACIVDRLSLDQRDR